MKSINLSEGPRRPVKSLSEDGDGYTKKYFSNQNQPNFSLSDQAPFQTLGQISKDEKIDIIKTGFRLKNEGKISFQKYYEGTGDSSLFQLRGYRIKYESIRRTKLYLKFKEESLKE